MTTGSARALMARYFETMSGDGDLGRHMSDDVGWTTVESGQRVRGREAVTETIRALHARMADVRTRTFAVTDDVALVEGDCVPAPAATEGPCATADRVPWAVVYDIALGRITDMRLYMAVSRLGPGSRG